jgi:fibronectin type 3 domain-containing protein
VKGLMMISLCALLAGICQAAQAVKLAWNPNPEPDISHYVLYWWQSDSPALRQSVTVGCALNCVAVDGLEINKTYIFGVVAHNSAGFHSRMSETVEHSTHLFPYRAVTLRIEASEDLKGWREIGLIAVPEKDREFFRIKIEKGGQP